MLNIFNATFYFKDIDHGRLLIIQKWQKQSFLGWSEFIISCEKWSDLYCENCKMLFKQVSPLQTFNNHLEERQLYKVLFTEKMIPPLCTAIIPTLPLTVQLWPKFMKDLSLTMTNQMVLPTVIPLSISWVWFFENMQSLTLIRPLDRHG